MINQFDAFLRSIKKPFGFSMFMLTKLPAALFAGLKIESITYHQADVSVRYKWFNKNPFQSTYFAVLSMPAEVSTGILCMGYTYKRNLSISMLLIKNEGNFYKKATGKTIFSCTDGIIISQAVNKALAGEPSTVKCRSIGKDNNDEVVAEFYFTWSFKARR